MEVNETNISDLNANSISTIKAKILLGKQGCIYDH